MTEGVEDQWCHDAVLPAPLAGGSIEEKRQDENGFDKRSLARVVVNAAIVSTVDQQDSSSEVPSSADSKSTAWLALSAALTKATGHAHSSTATPPSDPSLSEVSSSHGGLSPRVATQDHSSDVTFRPIVGLRWADEPDEREADIDFLHFCQDSKTSYEQEEIGGADPTTPSKRSRRSNRRRRARAEKASGAAEMHESTASHGSAGSKTGRSLRDSVTVGDLFGHDSSATPAQLLRTPQRRGQADEVAWFMPLSPCQVQSGSMGIVSTSPCGGQSFHGEASLRIASGYPQHPIGVLAQSACMPQAFGTPVHSLYTETVPRSPCNARAGPTGIVSTSPLSTMTAQSSEASSRAPPPLLEMSSPCHARSAATGGIISTSPANFGQVGVFPACNTTSEVEARTVEPAGSPTADALRSWLHASGLPACADLAWHLRAAASETYED
mmetsp:Transcript_22623/g.35308  ORF Transcript_22623/g.35308 Transcript_22623/m.35308 type:complete len:440 (-) Transcript_22623:104-1423(-)